MALSTYDVSRHNIHVLEDLEVGDMVEFPDDLYSHWGVYIGGEEVVHLTGDQALGNAFDGGSFSVSGVHYDKAMVKIENFFDVAGERIAKKNNDKDKGQKASGIFPRSTSAIVGDALAMKNKVMEYNVFFNNCEHFASYLRYGEKRSEQADTAIASILIGGAAVVVAGLIRSWFNRKD